MITAFYPFRLARWRLHLEYLRERRGQFVCEDCNQREKLGGDDPDNELCDSCFAKAEREARNEERLRRVFLQR